MTPVSDCEDVAANLAEVRGRIARAGGSTDSVTIVAVTKGQGPEAAAAAVAAGLRDLGENYADALLAKASAAGSGNSASAAGSGNSASAAGSGNEASAAESGNSASAAGSGNEASAAGSGNSASAAGSGNEASAAESGPPRWHFLGHVQRNKVRRLAAVVHLWQGVDRLAAGREISRRAPGAGVLVQVNVSGEPQKNGCPPDELVDLVDGLRDLGLDVRGLMAVAATVAPELARPGFRMLSQAADRLGLAERSMGMSDDLEVAVQEGATMVRVGRALFGSGARQMSR